MVLRSVENCAAALGATILKFNSETQLYTYSRWIFAKNLVIFALFAIYFEYYWQFFCDFGFENLLLVICRFQKLVWISSFFLEVIDQWIKAKYFEKTYNSFLSLEKQFARYFEREKFYKRLRSGFKRSLLVLAVSSVLNQLFNIFVVFKELHWWSFLNGTPFVFRIAVFTMSSLHLLAFIGIIEEQFAALIGYCEDTKLASLRELKFFIEHYDRVFKLAKTFLKLYSVNLAVKLFLFFEIFSVVLYMSWTILVTGKLTDRYLNNLEGIYIIALDFPALIILICCSRMGNVFQVVSL